MSTPHLSSMKNYSTSSSFPSHFLFKTSSQNLNLNSNTNTTYKIMSKSSTLSAIKRKTTEAIENFVAVKGQSIMKQLATVGAREAGVTDVHSEKYNGEHGGAYFSVVTPTVKEDHWFVKKSSRLEYIIIRTNPSDVNQKETLVTVYSVQMPQMPQDWGSVDGGGGASSSK